MNRLRLFLFTLVIWFGYGSGITYGYNQCFFNGLSINHWTIATGYKYSTIPYGQSYNCSTLLQSYETFQCNNGILSGMHGGTPALYTNINCNDGSPKSCILGSIFWQQITVPHFYGTTPSQTDLGVYLFTGYATTIVDNSNQCTSIPLSSSVTGNNTYVYCKNGILKDYILSNIVWSEQNFQQSNYPYTQCSQIKNSDCQINNTIIKDGESATFFASNSSLSGTCASETRTCTNGILSGSYYFTNCSNYNGACWLAHTKTFDTIPLVNLCSAGSSLSLVPSLNTTSHQRSRTCNGLQWTNETCIAYQSTWYQKSWTCWNFSNGATIITIDSPWLCSAGVPINLYETTYNWKWNCTSDYGVSSLCSAKKAFVASGQINYTTNSDGSVIASVTNISPYGAYIINNNNSNAKQFNQNWSFVFQLQYNDSVTYLTANVSSIQHYNVTINDLITDYTNSLCIKNPILLSQSSRYNLLDMQTMVNHCLIPYKTSSNKVVVPTGTVKRWEFIQSLFHFIQTIRPYRNNIYTTSNGLQYNNVPNTRDAQQAIQWLTTIHADNYISHTSTKNSVSYQWNSPITSQEIFKTLQYILNLHDDNDIYLSNLWQQQSINKTMKRAQYAFIMRKLLEQYDRTAIGNDIVSLTTIKNRLYGLWTVHQSDELRSIYTTIQQTSSSSFEKIGVSSWVLLYDISSLLQSWSINKKAVTTVSLQDIINKIPIISDNNVRLSPSSNNSTSLFKLMSY